MFFFKKTTRDWLSTHRDAVRSIRHLKSVNPRQTFVAEQQKMQLSWRPSKSLWALHCGLLFPQGPEGSSLSPRGYALILHPLSLIPRSHPLSILHVEWSLKKATALLCHFGATEPHASVFFKSQIASPPNHFPSPLFIWGDENNKSSFISFPVLSCINR